MPPMQPPWDLDTPNPLMHPAADDALRMLEQAQKEFGIRFPLRVTEYIERTKGIRREISGVRGLYVLRFGASDHFFHTIQERDPEYIARRMVLIATMIQEAEGERTEEP